MESIEERNARLGKPEWLDAWSDYPHVGLDEQRAREVVWYAIHLETELNSVLRDAIGFAKLVVERPIEHKNKVTPR